MLIRYLGCIIASAVSHYYLLIMGVKFQPAAASDSNFNLAISVIMWGYLFTYAVSSHKRDGDKSSWFQKLSLWRSWLKSKFRDISIRAESPLDQNKQYIFTAFPHGAVSANHMLSMTDAAGFLSNIHRGDRRDLAASILFYLPLVREILLLLGNVDASAATAKRQLEHKRSLLIFVGGEKEQLMTKHNDHKIFAATRMGFIKLALTYGVEVVPLYTYGENECYYVTDFAMSFRQWLQRNFSLGISLFWGTGFLWMNPLDVALEMEVGKAITLPKKFQNNNHNGAKSASNVIPSKEDIEDYHKIYISEMIRLFERTKVRHGVDKDVHLKIL